MTFRRKGGGVPAASVGVTPLQALTLGLATARLTQLVVDDEITEPGRKAVRRAYQAAAPGSQRETALDLADTVLNCHACSSVWAGGAVVTAELTGVGRFLVRVLALSQAALAVKAVIERIDR
ncbi:DUF1360 domain-containing protein [Longimicrobium sp.]|jgi:hypothetical protein|uniref:DUF1360 domain-containing protein n=1 Tax=Longimicrobium sp. TaxID=2029185 RepID=UPI002EDB72FC